MASYTDAMSPQERACVPGHHEPPEGGPSVRHHRHVSLLCSKAALFCFHLRLGMLASAWSLGYNILPVA